MPHRAPGHTRPHRGTLACVGTKGEGARIAAPADGRIDNLGDGLLRDAGDAGGRGSPPRPPLPTQAGRGGVTPPDPLAEAFEAGAARAYRDMAVEASRACPGWDITWDAEGFRASDGTRTLGPSSSPAGIRALVWNAP